MSTDNWNMLFNVLTIIIGYVAGPMARYLTAIVKGRFGTTGVTTQAVSAALSTLLAGVSGYLTGAYGHGSDGVIRAVLATLLAILGAHGAQKAAVQSSAVGSGRVSGDEVLR